MTSLMSDPRADVAPEALGRGTQLAAALRALLGASSVCRQDQSGDLGELDWMQGTTMRLGDHAGGLLTFERATLEFTPAEFARARALRDLAPPPPVGLTANYLWGSRSRPAVLSSGFMLPVRTR
jgi:hypothetical protein